MRAVITSVWNGTRSDDACHEWGEVNEQRKSIDPSMPTRAAVADDLRAPARTRGEDAVIQEQVHRGPGNEGCQLLQEFDALEEEVRRAIAPDGLEFDENAPVGAEADAVLGEWGAEQIATELLQASAIVGGTQTLAWRSKQSSWA
jgi:hypothetical protein